MQGMPGQHAPYPRSGAAYLDARGGDRALRVSWHGEADVVVLSLWRDNVCVGTLQLALEDVPDLIDQLAVGPARQAAADGDHPGETMPIAGVG